MAPGRRAGRVSESGPVRVAPLYGSWLLMRPSTPDTPHSMDRQGLIQAIREAVGRRLVPIRQLAMARLEHAQRLGVHRLAGHRRVLIAKLKSRTVF